MTTYLYHGPGAKVRACTEALTLGVRVASIGDDEVPSAEGMRDFIKVLHFTPPGSKKGIVLIGQVDLLSVAAADVLLKPLEQHDLMLLPLLWATDLDGVLPTIRSRCQLFWSPARNSYASDILESVGACLKAYRTKDVATLCELVKKMKGQESLFLACLCDTLSRSGVEYLSLWLRLREVTTLRVLNQHQLLAALLP